MRWLLGLLLAVAVIGGGTVYAITDKNDAPETCDGYEFDADAWRAWQGRRGPEQTAIAERLVECRLLVAKTERQVRQLLGRPDERSQRRPLEWSYELGPEDSAFSVDSDFLTVTFRRSGRVKRARIFTG